MPTLASIQRGTPRAVPVTAADFSQKPWTSAFFKLPVAGVVRVTTLGLEGDGVADVVNHGGADKAVCAYPAGHRAAWEAELGLAEFPGGAFGENFTIHGLAETDVCVGDVYRVGSAVVQVSQPREPCWKLARRWNIKDLAARSIRTGRTGWYFRVLDEGEVEAGQSLTLVERPRPEWTIERANGVMHHHIGGAEMARELTAVPELSGAWREELGRRG